jgi:hypothetical protein
MSHDPKFHLLPTTIVTDSTPLQMSGNSMYIADHTSLVNLILPHPSTCIAGSIIQVSGTGSGLWQIDQGDTGQIIALASQTSSPNGGYITSTNSSDCVTLICAGNSSNTWVISTYTGTINFY